MACTSRRRSATTTAPSLVGLTQSAAPSGTRGTCTTTKNRQKQCESVSNHPSCLWLTCAVVTVALLGKSQMLMVGGCVLLMRTHENNRNIHPSVRSNKQISRTCCLFCAQCRRLPSSTRSAPRWRHHRRPSARSTATAAARTAMTTTTSHHHFWCVQTLQAPITNAWRRRSTLGEAFR